MENKRVELRNIFLCLASLVILLNCQSVFAFENNKFALGAGYYSQNIFNAVSTADTGNTGLLGETSYPLNLRYETGLKSLGNWYFAPQLSYLIIPRKTSDDMAKQTFAHLVFSFGKDFARQGNTSWDWSVGPGIMRYETKGNGGITTLSNGTGTSDFAIPGRTITIQKITTVAAISFSAGSSRIGADLIIENLISSTKRAQSLMLSYAYRFGGAQSSSSSSSKGPRW